MPTMTLSFTPDELRELVAKALSVQGRKVDPGDITFVISTGFPGTKDPRERSYPDLDKMTVRLKTGEIP